MKKYLSFLCILLVFTAAKVKAAEYNADISASYGTTDGNSKSTTTSLGIDLGRHAPEHELDLGFEALFRDAESEDNKETESYRATGEDKHFFVPENTGLFWYQNLSWEQNRAANIEKRYAVAPGCGYRLKTKWGLTGLVEVGPNALYEELVSGREKLITNGRGYAELELDVSRIGLYADAEYLYPLNDKDNYRVEGNGRIDISFSDNLAIRFGTRLNYRNVVPEWSRKVERLDVSTMTSLVVSF